MKTKNTKYISIYLDESGSGNSPFFIVGGFYLLILIENKYIFKKLIYQKTLNILSPK
ncbi:DUF3800 domain-containing protein [Mycoplasma mycoides]|uniref:DUF3800 domain-containing protein n=1 Tax=Mycoplasma mycoides TaxID=2102 RepID=UPI00037B6BF6|nr:DUF3800 domain-containing protein [Mycoplasma mycoides]